MERQLSKFRTMKKQITANQNLTPDEMRAQIDKVDEAQAAYLRSMQLPKMRAMADVTAKPDLLVRRMLQ
jgi:DNA-binding IclR family transcriptional regulator